MATFSFQVEGMQELFTAMKRAGDKALGVAAQGLYEGAGLVADAVSKEINAIQTEPFKYAKDGKKRRPSPEEKDAIKNCAHGVAKFRKKLDRVDTSVGFNGAGYVDVNFKHMSESARTNYKAVSFKGHESNSSSYLKALRSTKNREKYGISSDFGKGAQNQKPIGVIANSINSGTSFMVKQPFMRKAFSQTKAAATAAIEAGIKARLEELEIK